MILKIAGEINQPVPDILAADIGGTKTNISLCHWNGSSFSFIKEASYKTNGFDTIESLIETFVTDKELPEKISLAVAGPVQNNTVLLTNINWRIDAKQLESKFKKPVLLINDLEAVGYSLAVLNDEDIHVLHSGEKHPCGNAAVIAPGTGLGEAGLYYDDRGYHPFATEGGHTSFAPQTEIDIELYRYLARKFEHVSWERVVSGPGICFIYDFLVQVKERKEPPWIKEKMLLNDKAIVISENINDCAVCKETIDTFIRLLAEECGNLALKTKTTGGIFIAGGIVPDLISAIHKEFFLKQFFNFGRLRNLLQSVPVHVILNKKSPLIGAAYFAIRRS
ncbi:MAG TPA: glucokinase [Flavisolibacter sp.]|nr:glucokinase [Flavisolibacter sp.]